MQKSLKTLLCCLMLGAILFLSACTATPAVHIIEETNDEPEYLSFFSNLNLSGTDVTKYWTDLFTRIYDKQVYIDFDGASYYADEGLSYRELLKKRLQSTAPDDLYIINAEDVIAFEQNGYWMDLSNMDFVKNLSDAALYQSTYNGKVFSLPLSYTGFGFVWNVDMLAKYGLTVPENLDAFFAVCEQLKAQGVLPYAANKGYSLTVPAMCAGFARLYAHPDREALIAALNSGEVKVSEYLKDGYTLLAQMIERGYLDPVQALNTTPGQEDIQMFINEECAFACISLSELYAMLGVDFQLVLTGLPVLENGSIAICATDKRLCINPNSQHLSTALEFVETLGTYEALEQSARIDNVLPSSKANTVASTGAASALVALLQRSDQVPNQDFSLHFNTWESIRDVARTLCQGGSVKDACTLLDQKQQADLSTYTAR